MVTCLTHGDGTGGWGGGEMDAEDGGDGKGGDCGVKRVGEERVRKLFRVHELAHRSL